MRRFPGGEKANIFIRGADGAKVVGRASGMLSIRGPEVSLGSPRVGTRRVQSPTPYTLALGSYLPILLAVQLDSGGYDLPMVLIQSFGGYGMPKAHAQTV